MVDNGNDFFCHCSGLEFGFCKGLLHGYQCRLLDWIWVSSRDELGLSILFQFLCVGAYSKVYSNNKYVVGLLDLKAYALTNSV